MSIKVSEASYFPKIIQQNTLDLKEIQADNMFQLMLAAEEIGKRKQFFEDSRLLLVSEGNRLRQEISLLKTTYDAEWKATTDNIHYKINAMVQKVLNISKSYTSQKMSEDEFKIKHQSLNHSGQFLEEGKLWYRHHALDHYNQPFMNIAAHLLNADEKIICDAKIHLPATTTQQIVNAASKTDLQPASKPSDYFLRSSQILAILEERNNQLAKENETLNTHKAALKRSHEDLIKQFKASIPSHIQNALEAAKNEQISISREFLDHQEKYKSHPCTENFSLYGRFDAAHEMAKEALNNINEVKCTIERILKE